MFGESQINLEKETSDELKLVDIQYKYYTDYRNGMAEFENEVNNIKIVKKNLNKDILTLREVDYKKAILSENHLDSIEKVIKYETK